MRGQDEERRHRVGGRPARAVEHRDPLRAACRRDMGRQLGGGVILRHAGDEQQPVAAWGSEPQVNQLAQPLLAMEARVEERDGAGPGRRAEFEPGGAGDGEFRFGWHGYAVGRHADGLLESKRTDVVGLLRARGVPAGGTGQGAGMHKVLREGLAPAAVFVGPATHHAAGRNHERHIAAAGGLMGIAQGQEPERMVVHAVELGTAEMRAQFRRAREPAGRDARKHPETGRILAVHRDGRAGLDGREQFDCFPECGEIVGQRPHRLRRSAVAVFEARYDMADAHEGKFGLQDDGLQTTGLRTAGFRQQSCGQ